MPSIQKKGKTKKGEKEKRKGGKRKRTLAQKEVTTKKKAKTSDQPANYHGEHHLKGERNHPDDDTQPDNHPEVIGKDHQKGQEYEGLGEDDRYTPKMNPK